jgi:hypothetical protein
MSIKKLVEEMIDKKLNENVLSNKQVKELEKYFDVTKNKSNEAQIKVDMGGGVDLVDIKIKNGKVESSSEAMGKQKFNTVDELVASLMDGT